MAHVTGRPRNWCPNHFIEWWFFGAIDSALRKSFLLPVKAIQATASFVSRLSGRRQSSGKTIHRLVDRKRDT